MNLSVNLEGIQENKKYVLEFCLKSDGKTVRKIDDSDDEVEEKPIKKTRQKESKMPSLDDIESSHRGDYKQKKETTEPVFDRSTMKIETSYGDQKINES